MPSNHPVSKRDIWKVISVSSAGTLIEWYDFSLFGSLATSLSAHFFPKDDPMAGLLMTLATFATGFAVRPFGALVFGRLGDIAGRKYAFMISLLLMGGSTFLIGCLPGYESIGILAPLLLVVLRLLQGLALGGEYGGAATYLAEHVPDGQRGFYTSFIQTTATLGLFLSLGVILAARLSLGEETFQDWGWRLPFLLSISLVFFSSFIRRKMRESPIFLNLKLKGKASRTPLKDSFAVPENRRMVILALFGVTAGQGAVWYTGQLYALYFLQTVLKVNFILANEILAYALLMGTPFFVFFGWLSDLIGRKKIMMTGLFLAVLTYIPIYRAMVTAAGFDPSAPDLGSPAPNVMKLTLLIFIQVIYVTMVYGPVAAFLVELFPTKIRYTSISLPYHVGNGIFGGLVPLIGTWAVATTGNLDAGLFYPMAVATLTFVIGSLLVRETSQSRMWDQD